MVWTWSTLNRLGQASSAVLAASLVAESVELLAEDAWPFAAFIFLLGYALLEGSLRELLRDDTAYDLRIHLSILGFGLVDLQAAFSEDQSRFWARVTTVAILFCAVTAVVLGLALLLQTSLGIAVFLTA